MTFALQLLSGRCLRSFAFSIFTTSTVALTAALTVTPAEAVINASCTFASSPTECGFNLQAASSNRATLVGIGRDGGTSVRLRTEAGDTNVYGSGSFERADLSISAALTGATQGNEQWWGHSILFPDDYVPPPANTNGSWNWGVLFDFHNSTDGASQANFQINAMATGLSFQGYGGDPYNPQGFSGNIGPIVKNTWYDFVYHVKWSSGGDGFFYAWVNGVQKLAYNGPTLYYGQAAYLKLANYHTPMGVGSSVIHDRVIVATSSADITGGSYTAAPASAPSAPAAAPTVQTRVANDFDGDGRADIFWRNPATGQNTLWLMNGVTATSGLALPTVADANWKVAKIADYNGDGRADVLWRNSATGATQMWIMNGATVVSSTGMQTVSDQNWKISGAGDFDGDGKADILWHNVSTGASQIWFMDGANTRSQQAITGVPDQNWKVGGVGDLNGDGKADIVWHNDATGANQAWIMNGTTVVSNTAFSSVPDLSWKIVGMGDFNGDGKADIAWRNTSTGENAVFLMNGPNIAQAAQIFAVPDQSWQVVGIGDLDGDGKSDIIWRNSATGQDAAFGMNGATAASVVFINSVSDLNWGVSMPR